MWPLHNKIKNFDLDNTERHNMKWMNVACPHFSALERKFSSDVDLHLYYPDFFSRIATSFPKSGDLSMEISIHLMKFVSSMHDEKWLLVWDTIYSTYVDTAQEQRLHLNVIMSS